MASSTSPFTYEAVEVIFGSIYFYFHIQTAPNLQDCPHLDNLTTIPESTLFVKNTNICFDASPLPGILQDGPPVCSSDEECNDDNSVYCVQDYSNCFYCDTASGACLPG